jgi:glucokinase
MTAKYTLAFDVGGTKIKAGLVKADKVFHCQTYPTEKKSAQKFLTEIEIIIKSLINPKVSQIGIATAGLVRKEGNQVDFVPHFPKGLINIPLKRRLEKKFGLPVKVDNDVNCFILAELKYGAARGLTNVIGLTLGTGIGGGIIIDGKLYQGHTGMAGEFGHIIIEAHLGWPCRCGKLDDFETLAAGPALEKWYKKITGKKKSTYEISEMTLKNNPQALKSLSILAKYLGIGISNLITIFNPEMVIIGGGLAEIKKLWPLMRREIKKNLLPEFKNCPVAKAKLGTNAGLVGASLI